MLSHPAGRLAQEAVRCFFSCAGLSPTHFSPLGIGMLDNALKVEKRRFPCSECHLAAIFACGQRLRPSPPFWVTPMRHTHSGIEGSWAAHSCRLWQSSILALTDPETIAVRVP